MTYRLLAYKNFTEWVYGRLGKGVRKVIPSCAVNLIRKTFPEGDGQYSGFQEGDIKDAEYEASWNLELQV